MQTEEELKKLDKEFQEKNKVNEESKENQKNKINTKFPKNMNIINLIVLGMAGSGKTTFVSKLEEIIAENNKESYIINLDPAVMNTIYEPNLDIRDTIKYRDVMKNNNLGPNGAILTTLNLFSTNIDKVISLLEEKKELNYIVIDSPGQLEVFSWSASGKLITDSFSMVFPSILIYIVDIPRCNNPNTFTSNMLYALSIMYKMKIPLILVFNKKDLQKETKVFDWLNDFQTLQEALQINDEFISSFSSSLSLLLDEFYKTIKHVAVSSKTGEGFQELLKQCDDIIKNYKEEVNDTE